MQNFYRAYDLIDLKRIQLLRWFGWPQSPDHGSTEIKAMLLDDCIQVYCEVDGGWQWPIYSVQGTEAELAKLFGKTELLVYWAWLKLYADPPAAPVRQGWIGRLVQKLWRAG